MIKIKGLSKSYNNNEVLKEINMEFSRGKAYGIVGENGAGLYEHEYDHVYFGTSNTPPIINLSEVDSYEYKTLECINKEIKNNPETYTEWFKICFIQVVKFYNKNL